MRDFLFRYKWVIAALLVTRLGMVAYVYPDAGRLFNGDSWLYEQYGVSLLETGSYLAPGYGKWMGYDSEGNVVGETLFGYDPFADMIRPPGLPVVVAMVYGVFGMSAGVWVLSILTALLSVITLWMLTLFLRLFRLDHIDWILWVFVFDPIWIMYSKEILTEPFFVPLVLGGLYLGCIGICRLYVDRDCRLHFPTSRWASSSPIVLIGSAGLLFGTATLFKPITLYAPLAGSIFLLILLVVHLRSEFSTARNGTSSQFINLAGLKSGGLAVLVFYLSASALIWAWQYRNYQHHGSFVFTSIQAENLMTGHAAFVLAHAENLSHTQAQDSIRVMYNQRHPSHGDYDFDRMSEAKQEIASEILSGHTRLYAWAIVRGMAITMMDPGRLVVTRTFAAGDQSSKENFKDNHDWTTDYKVTGDQSLKEDPVSTSSSEKRGSHEIGLTDIVARDGVLGALQHLIRTQPELTLFMIVHLFYLGMIFILASIGLVQFIKKYPVPAALIVSFFLYLWVLGGPSGYARFRMYLLPMMLLFMAFVPVGSYFQKITTHRDRSKAQT